MNTSAMEEVINTIRTNLPTQPVSRTDEEDYSKAFFQLSSESDYDIVLYVYPNEGSLVEGGIHALLRAANARASFWYMPFEQPDYKSTEDLIAALTRSLGKLLSAPSRVTQKRGPILWHFLCEYLEGAEWQRLYGMGSLRFTITVPAIDGNVKVYRGSPLKQG